MKHYVLKIEIVQRPGYKFQFLDRTFAEYFAAQRILNELVVQNTNVNFQRFFVDEILVGHECINSLGPNISENYLYKYKNYWISNTRIIFILSVRLYSNSATYF